MLSTANFPSVSPNIDYRDRKLSVELGAGTSLTARVIEAFTEDQGDFSVIDGFHPIYLC
jgi:hypothetical protein